MKRIRCLLTGHDWDLVYHSPSGSGFTCMRCPAEQHSGDKRRREVPWAGYLARRRFQKRLRETKPLKIEEL